MKQCKKETQRNKIKKEMRALLSLLTKVKSKQAL
jgi:hypothetical protein